MSTVISQPRLLSRRREQRQSPRVPLYAHLELVDFPRETWAVSCNISTGGLAMRVQVADGEVHRLGSGNLIEFRLRPPRGVSVDLGGQIVWSSVASRERRGRAAVTAGLRFQGLAPDIGRQLQSLVSSFRYRILVHGGHVASLAREVLGELFEVVDCNAEQLAQVADPGRVGLIVVGDSEAPDSLDHWLAALRGAGFDQPPPIVYCGAAPESRWLEASEVGAAPLLCVRAPLEAAEFLTLARYCVEAHSLGLENMWLRSELAGTLARVERENEVLRSRLESPGRFPEIIGSSPPMQAVFVAIERVAPYDTNVVVVGETGTGKDLVARSIHRLSKRSERPFLAQNCAALQDSLLESELFGYRRGAFTGAVADRIGVFEAANGGTLFLDEVAETSPAMQAKLLRVLQDGELRPVGSSQPVHVDVRIIAAAQRGLEDLVRKGSFREDLYYRLASFEIRLPPLRERVDDIQSLLSNFLAHAAARFGRSVPGVSAAALDVLKAQPWPGNVRQLQHVVERLLILSGAGATITVELLREAMGLSGPSPSATPEAAGALYDAMGAYERQLIGIALDRAGGNLTRAAELLGMNRSTLSRRCKQLGIAGGGSRHTE